MEINIYNNPDFPLKIQDKNIIYFDYGLPGFEDLKKFTIVDIEDYNPFLLLHSVEDYNIAMIEDASESLALFKLNNTRPFL